MVRMTMRVRLEDFKIGNGMTEARDDKCGGPEIKTD
jgi:hypothetical protein